jgi:glycine/D-amino acid oxidase-like deaminating enzyme
MTGRALTLVHSAPEVRDAQNEFSRKRDDRIHAGDPNVYIYNHREDVLRKEAGRLAMEALHRTLSGEAFEKMHPKTQLAFIQEGLSRAYGNTAAPAKIAPSEDDAARRSGGTTLRGQLESLAQRANAFPEKANSVRATRPE